MGQYVDLLRALPPVQRNVARREASRDPRVVHIAKQYGREYFDGDRKYGYGGYIYDGRWRPVVEDIIEEYDLAPGDSVLDVGCAKGFLVHDLLEVDLIARGCDVSEYAIASALPSCRLYMDLASADELPYSDKSFDLVLSVNTLHNLPRDGIIRALREITRVSRGKAFVQVDSYRTPEERALFEQWVLTAAWHGYPDDWLALFAEAGYDGDYAWTVVES